MDLFIGMAVGALCGSAFVLVIKAFKAVLSWRSFKRDSKPEPFTPGYPSYHARQVDAYYTRMGYVIHTSESGRRSWVLPRDDC